jgi:hypothetical protein
MRNRYQNPVAWSHSAHAFGLGALLLALVAQVGPAMGQSRWPEAHWNPKPLPDDLILPLPCNGAMAFRPVETPVTSGYMADRSAMMGQSNPESNYKEYLRQTYLLGPFRGGDASSPPVYYLAKYEVTKDQYDAVMTRPEACQPPSVAGSVSQTGVAWHDAINFTVRMTRWVIRNAADSLPKQGGASAFVRLPTEDEWEYAARGGSAVSEADFGGRVFPMEGDLNRYVWFQGSRSAQGRVNIIGRREPNPLGLFDILGNVSEWVLDPYRLNKVGRPHGLAGGYVVRGGDYRTAEDNVRTSLREEIPPFAPNGDPSLSPSIGFRPALAMVVEFNDQRPVALRDAFQKEVDLQGAAANDPRKLLERLREDAKEPAVKDGITKIEGALNAETRAKKDQESLTLRAQIEAAGFIGRQIVVGNNLRNALAAMANQQDLFQATQTALVTDLATLAGGSRDDMKSALGRLSERARGTVGPIKSTQDTLTSVAGSLPERVRELATVYTGVILSVGRSADRARVADEGKVVLQQVQARTPRITLLSEMIEVAIRHAEQVSAGRAPSVEQVQQDLLARATAAQPPPSPQQQRR